MLDNKTKSIIEFNQRLANLYEQIKKMKLKTCVTIDKKANTTTTAKIIKKSITKRLAATNEIIFKMDDYMSYSIHEHNIDKIIINDDSIQLFDNDSYTVTLTK
jgi:hypothetical protein